MSKPPKIVIPGLNRGSGIPGGYVLGRRRGTKQGPAELLNLTQVRAIGIATTTDVTTSTSLVQSIAHSETISLSRSVSTSLSAISSSLSGAVSSTTSLSSAVSTVISGSISSVNSRIDSLSTAVGGGTGTSTSLSQISSSLSGAISSTSSLSTAVSTVDANQSSSLSSDLSKITSLSTVVSGSISSANSRIDSLSTAGGGGGSTWNVAGANVDASENTASTSYTNLTTSGPSVTMVTGSVAFIDVGAVTFKTTAAIGNNAFISVDVSGATTIAAADANGTNVSYTVTSSGFTHMLSRRFKLSGLTPGTNTFTLKYRVNGATFGFDLRSIVVESDTTS